MYKTEPISAIRVGSPSLWERALGVSGDRGRASLSAGFWGGAERAWMEILTKECIYDPCAFLDVYTE